MENTFELTEAHTNMLNSMDDETKDATKHIVDTFGYYTSIAFFMAELNMSEDKAKLLADIGCYVLRDYNDNE
jgi:hypothetical protein